MRDATIDDYRWLYANGYMPDGLKCADGVALDILTRLPATFLDFGGGRGQLADLLMHIPGCSAYSWDPAHQGNVMEVGHFDYVVSCDVLEHIPADNIDATLQMLGGVADYGLLLTIANMSDVHLVRGEEVQLHLIRKEMGWWTEKLREHFPTATIKGRAITCNGDRFAIVVDF